MIKVFPPEVLPRKAAGGQPAQPADRVHVEDEQPAFGQVLMGAFEQLKPASKRGR